MQTLSDAQIAEVRAYFAEARERGTWVTIARWLKLDDKLLRRMWKKQIGGLPPGCRSPAPVSKLSDAEIFHIRAYFAGESSGRKTWTEIAAQLETNANTLLNRWKRQVGDPSAGYVKH